MNFQNLTEHVILLPNGKRIEPSGVIARCRIDYHVVVNWDGVDLVREVLSGVTGVPDQMNGTIYIVSRYVRRALPMRNDLASPGRTIKDKDGNIIAATNLVID